MEDLLQLRDAALQLGISFPTIKQWIYKNKIRSVRPPEAITGFRKAKWTNSFSEPEGEPRKNGKEVIRRVSGRNQLVGRIDSVRISGLMAEVKISIGGQQITSIITASSAREMQSEEGTNRRRPDQSHGSDDHPRVNQREVVQPPKKKPRP